MDAHERRAHLKRIAPLGGRARAARLTPERRQEIARQGFQALVRRKFGGDRGAAVEHLIGQGRMARLDRARAALAHLARAHGLDLPPDATAAELRAAFRRLTGADGSASGRSPMIKSESHAPGGPLRPG
jgi:hypothetical protein